MNTDATGRPLPPGWGKPRRRRSHAYRLRRAMRRLERWRRIRDSLYAMYSESNHGFEKWLRAMARVLQIGAQIRRMGGWR